MTKRNLENYVRLCNRLVGYNTEEVNALLRCEKTISRFAENECNGAIQRDEDETPYWYNVNTGNRICKAKDMEKGARKRAEAIAIAHGDTVYFQGDPRGCTIYILKPGMTADCYTNGIAILYIR